MRTAYRKFLLRGLRDLQMRRSNSVLDAVDRSWCRPNKRALPKAFSPYIRLAYCTKVVSIQTCVESRSHVA